MKNTVSLIAVAAVAVVGLTGCSAKDSKDKPAADRAQTPLSSLSASSSPRSPSPSPSHQRVSQASVSAVGANTNLDPCQLVTQDEASALAHASFGPGKEEGAGVRKDCVYGAQTPNVMHVFVIQAASAADATSGWNQLLAEAKQSAGQAAGMLQLSSDSTIGDRAEWVELDLAQIHVSGRGLAFQKGAVAVYVIDLVRGGSAPSRDAMTAQAQTVLGRLP
jgi:hypothetical protein